MTASKTFQRLFLGSVLAVLASSAPLFADVVGSNRSPADLVTIDSVTGAGTSIGSLGFDFVAALAYDSNTGTVYGLDNATDQLITIDQATGVGTAVGSVGYTTTVGLAFDPNTDTLYGTD
ncbi:MAG: hypothetical protein N2C14_31575, partial [Planctomycetales bacterium]